MFLGVDNKINLFYYSKKIKQITGGFEMLSFLIIVLVYFVSLCQQFFLDSKQNSYKSLFFYITLAGLLAFAVWLKSINL